MGKNTYDVLNKYVGRALIGHANGFQSSAKGWLKSIELGRYFYLNNQQIVLERGTELLMILREVRKDKEGNNQIHVYFALYRFAREVERNRAGGFYGSVLGFNGALPDPDLTYQVLYELIEKLKPHLSQESKFRNEIENIPFEEPASISALFKSLSPINQHQTSFNPSTEFPLIVLANGANSMKRIISFTTQGDWLPQQSKIFATGDKSILDYVKKQKEKGVKGIYRISEQGVRMHESEAKTKRLEGLISRERKNWEAFKAEKKQYEAKLRQLSGEVNQWQTKFKLAEREKEQLRENVALLKKQLSESNKAKLIQEIEALQIRESQQESILNNQRRQIAQLEKQLSEANSIKKILDTQDYSYTVREKASRDAFLASINDDEDYSYREDDFEEEDEKPRRRSKPPGRFAQAWGWIGNRWKSLTSWGKYLIGISTMIGLIFIFRLMTPSSSSPAEQSFSGVSEAPRENPGNKLNTESKGSQSTRNQTNTTSDSQSLIERLTGGSSGNTSPSTKVVIVNNFQANAGESLESLVDRIYKDRRFKGKISPSYRNDLKRVLIEKNKGDIDPQRLKVRNHSKSIYFYFPLSN